MDIWYVIIWLYMMCIITLYVCVHVCMCMYVYKISLPTHNPQPHVESYCKYCSPTWWDPPHLESDNKIHFLCTFMFCRGVILQENHVTPCPLLKHFRAFLYFLYTHFKLTWHTKPWVDICLLSCTVFLKLLGLHLVLVILNCFSISLTLYSFSSALGFLWVILSINLFFFLLLKIL